MPRAPLATSPGLGTRVERLLWSDIVENESELGDIPPAHTPDVEVPPPPPKAKTAVEHLIDRTG
eukprot:5888515-Prymnesium_polylepis.1